MFASILLLNRADVKALRITDSYSLHRTVYDLFEDVRTEQQKKLGLPSGILFADKGADREGNARKVLILSNRKPQDPLHGKLETKVVPENFLQYPHYVFEVTVNPSKREKNTGKIIPIRGKEQINQWFLAKAPQAWGFQVEPKNLEVTHTGLKSFEKKNQLVILNSATLKGELTVSNPEQFKKSFQQGLGRGSAFGFGLLQIVPVLV